MEKQITKEGTSYIQYLDIMIDLVKELYGNDLSTKDLAEYINIEFSLNITENDVNLYFSPSIQEEILDKELIYKNIGL